MVDWSNFKPYVPPLFIRVSSERSVFLNKTLREKLNAKYVVCLVNEKTKQLALKKCKYNEKGRCAIWGMFIRSTKLVEVIKEMNPNENKFYGEYLEEEKAVLFQL